MQSLKQYTAPQTDIQVINGQHLLIPGSDTMPDPAPARWD